MSYIYDLTDTWNAGGTVFTAIKMNVTNSASASGSKIISLQVNGTEQFSVDKDGKGYVAGNLGIGTSSPGGKLDVSSTTNSTVQQWQGAGTNFNLQLKAFDGSVSSSAVYRLGLDYLSGTYTNGYIDFFRGGDGASGFLTFGTAGTERARIDASGNVLIGTSNAYGKLAVAGSNIATNAVISGTTRGVRIGADSTFGYIEGVDNTGSASYQPLMLGGSDVRFSTNGVATERMRIDSSGNLGLGVTPSAWSLTGAFMDFAGNGTIGGGATLLNNGLYQGTNWYYSSGFKYKTSAGAAQYVQSASGHEWNVAPSGTAGNAISFTQAMTLDASGNLLVGTTSANGKLSVVGDQISIGSGAGPSTLGIQIKGTALTALPAAQVQGYIATGDSALGNAGDLIIAPRTSIDSNIRFVTGSTPAERVRIDGSGNLLVGTTSSDGYRFKTEGSYPFLSKGTGGAALTAASIWNNDTAGDNIFIVFSTETGGTTRGSIDYNRAGGLTRYNTTSDYRAKDIIGPTQNSGEVVDALKVYDGKMKGATIERPMLIAHEAQEVVPYAVTGEKDAVNEDGTPKFQQIDVSSLVPLLIAEIQSLRARVAQLEGK